MLNMRLYKLLGASLLTLSILIAGCGGSGEREAVYLERAQQYYDDGNYDKAKIEIKNVTQINPNNVNAIYLYARISEKEENYRGAFRNFRAATELDPEHIGSLNRLAYYYSSAKQYEQATISANKVLALDPENSEALASLAVLSGQQDMPESAIDYARRALAEDPGNVRAVTALTAGLAATDVDQALAALNEGLANQPEDASLKVLKIRLLEYQKKNDEVPELYRQLIDENPEQISFIYQLASFYLRDPNLPEGQGANLAKEVLQSEIAKNPEEDQLKIWLVKLVDNNNSEEEGLLALEKFVEASPDSEVLRDTLARSYLAKEDRQRAVALYAEVIERDPSSVAAISARVKLATIDYLNKDLEGAKTWLAEALALDAEHEEGLLLRARMQMEGGGFSEAIPDLRVVLKNNPENIQGQLLLAAAHEKTGSQDLSLDIYQALLSADANNLVALTAAGRILLAQNNVEAGQVYLERALEKSPANPEATRLLVSVYSQQQQWDKALSISAQLIEQEGTIAMGHYLQGRIYMVQKDYKQAIKSLEQSQEADDRVIESLRVLVAAYIAAGQEDAALKHLNAHVAKNKTHIHARELLAKVYAQKKDFSNSTEILLSIIKEYPDQLSSYRLLVQVYVLDNNMDAIEPLLAEGVKNSPQNIGLYMLQADYYLQRKDIDKAIAVNEKMLTINPDAIIVKNNLAAMLLDYRFSGANLERAAELANDLSATEVPAFLDTAGWVQFKLENYPQALALLQLAVDNGGAGPVYQYHLGMAYYKNDMLDDARTALTLALAEADDYPGKDEAKAVLEKL